MTTDLTRTLHRLSAAVTIADYLNGQETTVADVVAGALTAGTYHDHDHAADWPAECYVCGKPATVGIYCSDYHRIVMEGDPTKPKETEA